MKLCNFCSLQQTDGQCSLGHTVPQKMRCADFAPVIERFCASAAEYAGREQLRQMALFFGLSGKELKRVLTMKETWQPEAIKER